MKRNHLRSGRAFDSNSVWAVIRAGMIVGSIAVILVAYVGAAVG